MITLHTLYLDGWLSYDKTSFTLDEPGVTFIQGEVGAGKSAILEAIFYLLFGKTLRGKDTVKNLANKLLNKGYEIALDFSIDDVPYKIKEIRDRKKSGLFFYKYGKEKLGKTDPDTRKLIIEEIGMSAADFRAIAFLGQRQTQALVEGKPADRAKALVDIFGLGRYDALIKAVDADIKERTQSKKHLAELLETNERDLKSLEQSLLADGGDDVGSFDAKSLEKIENSITETAAKLTEITRRKDESQQVIGKIEALEKQRKHTKEIKQQIQKLKRELSLIKKPKNDADDLEDSLRELRRQNAVTDGKFSGVKTSLKRAKSGTNECPVTHEDCPVNVPKERSEETAKRLLKEKEELKTKLSTLEKKIKKVTKELTNTEEWNRLYEEIETKEELIKEITSEDADIDVASEQKKLKKYEASAKKGNEHLTKLLEKRTIVTSALAVLEERKSNREKVNAALEEKEENIETLKRKLNKRSIGLQYLAGALGVFKKMKMYKIDLTLELLNTHLTEILAEISDDEYKAELVSQQQTADKKKTLDKVGIIVYDSYKALPIELCSGGQATEVGLAVLLSTWKTANTISHKGVSSLWLDEVFGPLNEEIINRVFNSVIDVVNESGASSVKIISHRDLDPRLIDYTWDIHRENGITSAQFN